MRVDRALCSRRMPTYTAVGACQRTGDVQGRMPPYTVSERMLFDNFELECLIEQERMLPCPRPVSGRHPIDTCREDIPLALYRGDSPLVRGGVRE